MKIDLDSFSLADRPWSIEPDCAWSILDADGKRIAFCDGPFQTTDMVQANARLIVEAVNAYQTAGKLT